MSNKDNWDDESGDEEESTADQVLKEGGLLSFNLDTVNALESEAPIECDATENEEPNEEPNEEYPEEEGGRGGNPLEEYPDDEWDGEDEDYEDELDNYDKKLGRYVSCR